MPAVWRRSDWRSPPQTTLAARRSRPRAHAVPRRSRRDCRVAAVPAARRRRRRTPRRRTALPRGSRIAGWPWVGEVRELGQELLVVLERVRRRFRLDRQRVERRLILERLDVVLLPVELGVHVEKN